MIARLRDLAGDEAGTAIVEYALVLSLLSIVAYGALMVIGDTLQSFFISSSTNLGSVAKQAQ